MARLSIFLLTVAMSFIVTLAVANSPTQRCVLNSVCFAIDMSGSIDDSEYRREIDAVVSIARTIGSLTPMTSYSAHGFDTRSVLVSAPTKSLESVFVPTVRSHNRILRGGTSLTRGLSACYSSIKSAAGPRVIVLLTDGIDNRLAGTEATRIKNTGVDIVTVGIGNGIDVPYLRSLATSPDFFVQANFNNVASRARTITNKICTVTTTTPPSAACERAYKKCNFAIDGADTVPTIALGMNDKALTARIVSRKPGQRVGIVNANGGPADFILDNGSARPITEFGAQRFSPSTFKPYTIRSMVSFSGIGHQTLQSDQATVASGKCVRVFITNYQLIEPGPNGFVTGNVNMGKKERNCVVVHIR